MSAPARTPEAAVPAGARALAVRLAGLFKADQQLGMRLNDAHHQLAAANDQLCKDQVVDPPRIHQEVHSAFCACQQAQEQRRQLAVDVGELSAALTDVLNAAGYTPGQARSADVHQLAAGTWQPATRKKTR